jgi:hypothetical protein
VTDWWYGFRASSLGRLSVADGGGSSTFIPWNGNPGQRQQGEGSYLGCRGSSWRLCGAVCKERELSRILMDGTRFNTFQVGHIVIVTASPRDVERQKRLGASEVIDYKAPEAVDRLRQLGPYKYLFTASGDAVSQQALAGLLQPQGGKFASVLGRQVELPTNVEMIYTAFSQAAQQEEHSAWRGWWYSEYLPKVLQDGLVEPAVFSKVPGGLAALQQASTDVFEGKVRGKLVVNPQE